MKEPMLARAPTPKATVIPYLAPREGTILPLK